MKIAYVGNFQHPFCTEVHMKASLEELGHTVSALQENSLNWRSLPRMARTRRLDLVLWTRTWGVDNDQALAALQALRSEGVATASFHLDRWWGLDREYQVDTEAFFRTDVVVTADGGNAERWEEAGIKHRWLPPGVYGKECDPVPPRPDRFPHEVVFVGSYPYPHAQWGEVRNAMIQAVSEHFGDRFKVWPDNGRPIRGRELQTLYASCKVVVGDSCLAGGATHYWSDRIPETLGRGGVLVHPHVEGLGQWYSSQDLLTYGVGDHDVLISAIEGLLSDDDWRRSISEQGRATVLDRDTYVHRAQSLLAIVAGQDPEPPKPKPTPKERPAPRVATEATRRAAKAKATTGAVSVPMGKPQKPERTEVVAAPLLNRLAGETVSGCSDCEQVPMARCAVCGEKVEHVLCLGDQPIANRLRASEDEPVPYHPLHVVRCVACSTVQLVSRPAPEELFGDEYPYRSSQSRTMLASAQHLSEYVAKALQLRNNDLVVEVGSNDGYLLRQYLRHGVKVLGFDPASGAAADAEKVGVETVVEFFGKKQGLELSNKAMVIHANNVLAHVDDPDDLMAGMAAALRPEGVLVIETPWLASLIDAGAFDTIYHEHRFYWSAHALERLLMRHDLQVIGVEVLPELHGGTLRVFAESWQTPRGQAMAWRHVLAEERRVGLEDAAWARRFETIHRGQVEQLRRWWEGVQPAAAYGAAAKGTVLVHTLAVKPPLFVVDSTPGKQGMWTPCGSLILPPEELERRAPSDCVVFPWNFATEIAGKARAYTEAGGRLWTLIPSPRRVA